MIVVVVVAAAAAALGKRTKESLNISKRQKGCLESRKRSGLDGSELAQLERILFYENTLDNEETAVAEQF